jgi:ubiquinone/menaquinone biosynthesis C-methylase UbiE
MDEDGQAMAYAQADFESAHSSYPKIFAAEFATLPSTATVLDLGCGPADVTFRFARAFPNFRFHAVDGSTAMLRYARLALQRNRDIASRIQLIEGLLPHVTLAEQNYDVILSSSVLHHLHDPQVLWQSVRRFGKQGTLVFVADLFRPESRAAAEVLVEQYARNEPEVLRRDFLNSLLAAFSPEEVQGQLATAKLESLKVKVISDRHLIVVGTLGG